MRANIYFLLLILAVSSCSDGNEANNKTVSDIDEFKTYPIDVESKAVPIFDLIEEVEIVRLEETDSALLGYVFNLYQLDGNYVIDSGSDGDLFLYTSTGKFIRKFNHKGSGPGEYRYIHGLWTAGNSIFIYDLNSQEINSYNAEGEFQKSWKLNSFTTQVHSYGGGFVADLNYTPYQDSVMMNVLFLNEDNSVRSLGAPYENTIRVPIFSTINSFFPYKKGLQFHQSMNDTIYAIENDKVVPVVKMDFGKQWLWSSEELNGSQGHTLDLIRNKGLVWSLIPRMNESMIYFDFDISMKEKFYGLINRESGKYVFLDTRKEASEKYMLSALGWENDQMRFSLVSTDVAGFLKDVGEEKVKFRQGTTLEEIESSENPVLMWVKFKGI